MYKRPRLAAAAGLAALLFVIALANGAFSSDDGQAERAAPKASATPAPPELPRGGRTILPDKRVLAYYGAPQDDRAGRAGDRHAGPAPPRAWSARRRPYERPDAAGAARARADRRDRQRRRRARTACTAAPDRRGDPALPARRARRKALLLLDIQPGRSDFFTETTRLERWLREPDVGLALDPEWRVGAGEVPGQVIGRVDAREVNADSAWLAQLVERDDLPEKLVVVHQFTDDMVDDTTLRPRDGLEIVLNADGFGTRPVKKSKYDAFTRARRGFEPGFKLFYEEDMGLMTPRQVLRLRPRRTSSSTSRLASAARSASPPAPRRSRRRGRRARRAARPAGGGRRTGAAASPRAIRSA